MLETFQGIALLAAAITTGLMAGVFGLFAHAIMPGLGRSGDRTYVAAYQAIDRAIINPWFFPQFFGALFFNGLATGLVIDEGSVLPWSIAALALYLAAFVVTMRIHVPLNNEIKAAGDPDQIDVAAVRTRHEERWVRWNLVRTVLTLLSFGCLAWALVEFGKTLG